MLQVLFFRLTLFLYFLATVFFLYHLWEKKGESPAEGSSTRLSWSQRLTVMVTGMGFSTHTLALIIQFKELYIPFTNLHEALSFSSWAIILIFLLVEFRYHLYILGSFTLPLAFLLLISAATLPNTPSNLDPTLNTVWLGIHTTLSLLGIVAFAIAAIFGVMYLLQEKLLKSKQFNALYHKLPPLDLLDEWNKKTIFMGFPLLTLGMISGALWSQYSLGSFWSLDHSKLALSLGTWFFYLIVLHGRMTIGWRSKKAAYLAIIGFIGVIFIFVSLA